MPTDCAFAPGRGLTLQLDGHVATLSFSRPPLNFFDAELIQDLADTLDYLDQLPACRVTVLVAEGTVFCAGADFSAADQCDPQYPRRVYKSAVRLFRTRKPLIGVVEGAAAADNLVPVTLELGGKSPTIISRSADLAAAVNKILAGKLHNAGQICLAPDYVLVPEEKMAEFVSLARAAVAKLFPTLKDNCDYTSVINARHFQRLQGYLGEAREAGIDVIELNPAEENFADQAHHKIVPTLLINPDDSLKVMQDEIFGPLLPVKPYSDIQQVVAYINSHPRPLGLYYFGNHAAEQAFVLARTTSGGVCLNDVLRHAGVETLPFGGVGASGMGAYHGFDGFRTFSHAKAVLRAADGPDLMRPPYTDQVRQFVASLIKR
ncbi:aldehyde dehydrogenase family protein [Pseudomonas fluorescens]|uniref:aldehyde dehydrogenase family protein n=1 Tax=Pseudomonas fluorescens TaxID=294 RepID=UPI0017827EB0|nr:aldehyde dehydrogenase family protein [Pseudomonas fluorescens]